MFTHLCEGLKRPRGVPPGAGEIGAAASNKRTLGENRAARTLSRVMFGAKRRLALSSLCRFGAACSMRATFAAVNLRRQAVS